MESDSTYILLWCLYILAGLGFYSLLWWLTRSGSVKMFNYSMRGIMAAIIFTPWSANIHGDTLAPALMVLVLDFITIGDSSVVRAAVPLSLAVIFGELIAIGLCWKNRRQVEK